MRGKISRKNRKTSSASWMAKSSQPSDQSKRQHLMYMADVAWGGWGGTRTMRWKLKQFDENKHKKKSPEGLSNAEMMS